MEKGTAEKIQRELQSFDFVGFAMIFGSVAEERETTISDVDVGMFTTRDISLIEEGLVSARCERVIKRKVDIVVLNDLYKKRPVLVYEIMTKGRLLFCNDQDDFIDFKKNAFLYYFDTAPLRAEVDRRFRERLGSGKFGERNYVGKT